MDDRRVVYGAQCSWWNSIDKVGALTTNNGVVLPCCPHCGGVLLEMQTPEIWWESVDKYESNGHPGYHDFIAWLHDKCFKGGYSEAQEVYQEFLKCV